MFTSDWNRAAKILNWFIYIYSLRNHYPLNAFSWTGHKSISIPVDGYWWPNLSHTSMMEQSVCVCVSEENVESAASLSRSSLEVREQTHSSYGCLRAPPQNANINRHPAKHVAVMYHVGLCTQQVAWMRCWLWCGWGRGAVVVGVRRACQHTCACDRQGFIHFFSKYTSHLHLFHSFAVPKMYCMQNVLLLPFLILDTRSRALAMHSKDLSPGPSGLRSAPCWCSNAGVSMPRAEPQ